MVHVKVNYCHFFNLLSVCVFEVTSSHCSIVDVAKSIGLLLIALIVFEGLAKYTSVVTRWSYSTECIPNFFGHNLIDSFDDRATTEQGCLPSMSRHKAVSVIFGDQGFIMDLLNFIQLLTLLYHVFNVSIFVHS